MKIYKVLVKKNNRYYSPFTQDLWVNRRMSARNPGSEDSDGWVWGCTSPTNKELRSYLTSGDVCVVVELAAYGEIRIADNSVVKCEHAEIIREVLHDRESLLEFSGGDICAAIMIAMNHTTLRFDEALQILGIDESYLLSLSGKQMLQLALYCYDSNRARKLACQGVKAIYENEQLTIDEIRIALPHIPKGELEDRLLCEKLLRAGVSVIEDVNTFIDALVYRHASKSLVYTVAAHIIGLLEDNKNLDATILCSVAWYLERELDGYYVDSVRLMTEYMKYIRVPRV